MCSFNETSNDVIMFTRKVMTEDLIKMASALPSNSIYFNKHEESIFDYKVLRLSRGELRVKVDFGETDTPAPNITSDTLYNSMIDFGKQFQSNGTYSIKKAYCKQRMRRSITFADLAASSVKRGDILATIDTS